MGRYVPGASQVGAPTENTNSADDFTLILFEIAVYLIVLWGVITIATMPATSAWYVS